MRRGRDTREGVSGQQEGPEARNPPRFRWVLSTSSHARLLFRSGRPLSHLTDHSLPPAAAFQLCRGFAGFQGGRPRFLARASPRAPRAAARAGQAYQPLGREAGPQRYGLGTRGLPGLGAPYGGAVSWGAGRGLTLTWR